MTDQDKILKDVTQSEYKYGFITDIETDILAKGLNEDVIRVISEKKNEPSFMLDFRLEAFQEMAKNENATLGLSSEFLPLTFRNISYYAAPKKKPQYDSLDEVDPELIETFNKLGIPIRRTKTSCRCSS